MSVKLYVVVNTFCSGTCNNVMGVFTNEELARRVKTCSGMCKVEELELDYIHPGIFSHMKENYGNTAIKVDIPS